jgi:hypothetical protein
MWDLHYVLTFRISPSFVSRALHHTMQYLSVIFSTLIWCICGTKAKVLLHKQGTFPLCRITSLINTYPFYTFSSVIYFSLFLFFFCLLYPWKYHSIVPGRPLLQNHPRPSRISDVHKLIADMPTINKGLWWVAWDVL